MGMARHSLSHKRQRCFNCTYCGRPFAIKGNRDLHIRTMHINPPPMGVTRTQLECRICGLRNFTLWTDFVSHSRNHGGTRPYTCSVCNSAFKKAYLLAQHSVIHTDMRKYACEFCNRTFRQVSHVKAHEKRHLEIRPLKCILCQKSFRSTQNLENHVISHKNIKQVSCPLCPKMFKVVPNVYQHLKTAHQLGTENRKMVVPESKKNPVRRGRPSGMLHPRPRGIGGIFRVVPANNSEVAHAVPILDAMAAVAERRRALYNAPLMPLPGVVGGAAHARDLGLVKPKS